VSVRLAVRLGLDFDNTIVSYDSLFHKVAREGGWIPPDVPVSKVSVRDYLRRIGKEDVWTEMQGYVYGPRMAEAEMFPGVREFMRWARGTGLRFCIISHKTRHPFLGPRYDLHEAARAWVERSLRDDDGPFVALADVYFELTKEEKLARIAALGCNMYVDDLPEILLAETFPKQAERVLFDPDSHHGDSGLPRVPDWASLKRMVEARWRPNR